MILFLFVLLICAQDGWIDRATYVYISDPHDGVKWWSSSPWIGEIYGLQGRLVLLLSSLHFCNLLSCSNSLSRELLRACGCPLFILDHQPKPVEFHQFACSYQMAVDPCLSISFVTSVCQLFVLIHSAVLHQNSDTSIRYPHE